MEPKTRLMVQAVRRLMIGVFLSLLGLMLIGSAVFALIIQLLNQYNFIGRVFWDPAVAFSFGAMVIAAVFTALTFRESFWFKVMQIDSLEEEKIAELRAVVDDVVNQRLKREREDISA